MRRQAKKIAASEDEILKYKNLLETENIIQEEYETKKKLFFDL